MPFPHAPLLPANLDDEILCFTFSDLVQGRLSRRTPACLLPWLIPCFLAGPSSYTNTLWIASRFLPSAPLSDLTGNPLPAMGEMAQSVKVLAAKPDDLTLIPGLYRVERGNGPPKVVLSALSEHHGRSIPLPERISKHMQW